MRIFFENLMKKNKLLTHWKMSLIPISINMKITMKTIRIIKKRNLKTFLAQ